MPSIQMPHIMKAYVLRSCYSRLLLFAAIFNFFTCQWTFGTESVHLIDTVRCKNHPGYSYALYLPENYTDSANWPVIFIFDPGARGKLALTGFLEAAKQYGYILAGSNNSKNGLPNEELDKIINNLTTDIESKFSIDHNRIYTSGFSGGSRVASMVALKNSKVIGVIACGAGLPNSISDSQIPHVDYYGLVGDRDMNFQEMCILEEKLDSLGINTELRIFEGEHDWPSSDLLLEAVEWMELQAMIRGVKAKDSAFIISLVDKKENQIKMLLNQGKLVESVKYYENFSNWSPEYANTKHFRQQSDSIQQSKDYKKALKKWKEIRAEENKTQQTLISALKGIAYVELLPDSVRNWWCIQAKDGVTIIEFLISRHQ
jgi:tetratricopeptide (TPR) repeat protein